MIGSYGFIFLSPGADPATHRAVVESGGQRTTLVAVPDAAAGVPIAVDMVADGVQLIELCGVFGPQGTARVIDAVGGKVPVGAVGYGAESVDALSALTGGL